MFKRSSTNFNASSHQSNPHECSCRVNEKNAFESQDGKDSIAAAGGKSFVLNILPSSRAFSIFYPDATLSSAPNSNESRILARSTKKSLRTQSPVSPLNRTFCP